MYIIILVLFLAPYIISYFLYKKGMKWYKLGVALSFLFWITCVITVTLADKFLTDVDLPLFFFYYYVWMHWFYLGLLGLCTVFWLYVIIKGNNDHANES